MQPQTLTMVECMLQLYFIFFYWNETLKPNIGRVNVFNVYSVAVIEVTPHTLTVFE